MGIFFDCHVVVCITFARIKACIINDRFTPVVTRLFIYGKIVDAFVNKFLQGDEGGDRAVKFNRIKHPSFYDITFYCGYLSEI